MQKNDENASRLESALALCQRASDNIKKGRRTHGFLPLTAVLLAGVIATGGAYLMFDEGAQSGNFAMASSVLEDWVLENHTVAVFLGLDEANDHANETQEQEKHP